MKEAPSEEVLRGHVKTAAASAEKLQLTAEAPAKRNVCDKRQQCGKGPLRGRGVQRQVVGGPEQPTPVPGEWLEVPL